MTDRFRGRRKAGPVPAGLSSLTLCDIYTYVFEVWEVEGRRTSGRGTLTAGCEHRLARSALLLDLE